METDSLAIKFDNNKVRWDLMPFRALHSIAEILTYGANKYTRTPLSKLWSLLNAHTFLLYFNGECIGRVAKNHSGILAFSVHNEKAPSVSLPYVGKMTAVANWKDFEFWATDTIKTSRALKTLNQKTSCSLSQQFFSLNEAVQFAENTQGVGLFIATYQKCEPVFSVTSATDLNTCIKDVLRFKEINEPNNLMSYELGDRNWEKGDAKFQERCMAAAFRHMQKYMTGVFTDHESGLSHLAHAATNLLMVIDLEHKQEEQNAI